MNTANATNDAALRKRTALMGYLSLFGSLGTLLCCALPSLLILLGLGASVGSILSSAPWLVSLSRHKVWVFGLSGALIAAGFINLYLIAPRLRLESCDVADESCGRASRISAVLLWLSAGVYGVGFFTAFILGPILVWLDRR